MEQFKHILERIESKKTDFLRYDFTETENAALRIFFELAQEFESFDDFFRLCVAIPMSFFGLHCRLYLIEPKLEIFVLVAMSEGNEQDFLSPAPPEIKPRDHPYQTRDNNLVVTIKGNLSLLDELPFKAEDGVLGLLEVYPLYSVTNHDELFYEKYANRIGFNLHNRYLMDKIVEHLRFIKTLTADIEHNVIVPNMVFKLFLRRLKGVIARNFEIEKAFNTYAVSKPCDGQLLEDLVDVNRSFLEEYDNIERHYRTMSLFLETLLRRSHFDEGRLTLRRRQCNMLKEVVQPQLERFSEQFKAAGIEIDDRLSGIPEESVISVVDVGIMAQVYANFFSNALKYTEEITTDWGEKKKIISYGHELIRDLFGPGKDGAKFNVFSTGPHINPEERDKIFEEEYRTVNARQKPGTGHGLAFVKTAIEIHGGVVGYEPTHNGNNFYFILPK